MKQLAIFLFERTHFFRNPFKLSALLLYVLAGGYGLHNGAALYEKQVAAITEVEEKAAEDRQSTLAYYQAGEAGPKDRPWVDLREPFWAMWSTNRYHTKAPSPAMVYSIGQAEQYGFYKRVTFRSSPYDADMAEEISNPERLQTGTLDFTFVVLVFLPLLLLIFLHDLKGAEQDRGFWPLIEVQTASETGWLVSRVLFYVLLLLIINVLLLAYGASLTGLWSAPDGGIGGWIAYVTAYLAFWSVLFFLLLRAGKSVLGNTLGMVGLWLLFAFVIPAAVQQWVSLQKPANLMVDYLDATREDQDKIYNQPDSVIQVQLEELFPDIANSPAKTDSIKQVNARSNSTYALVSALKKERIAMIEADNQERNELIRASYWINPFTFFQNQFNAMSGTHYRDYERYRSEIQQLADHQLRAMVVDTWNDRVITEEAYREYVNLK